MFGYFRPNSAPLTGKNLKTFNAYYCRLCYCLWNLGGQSARALTTFDVTIYSMIINLFMKEPAPPKLNCQRIKKENMRKFSDDNFGHRLASLSFIAFGEKIRDDEIDGNKMRARFMNLFYKKAVKKAKDEEPTLAKIAFEATEKINELQKNNGELDCILDVYGKMTADSFYQLCPIDKPYYELIYYLSIWTFYVDMLCDYNDDVKEGAPNSFYQRECPTIDSYFNKNWHFLLSKNQSLSNKIHSLLLEIQDDSQEWVALYKIISYALNTVVQGILLGKDVTFHYFRELFNNCQRNRENKKIARREKK